MQVVLFLHVVDASDFRQTASAPVDRVEVFNGHTRFPGRPNIALSATYLSGLRSLMVIRVFAVGQVDRVLSVAWVRTTRVLANFPAIICL